MIARQKNTFSQTNFIARRIKTDAGKKSDHRIHTNDGHEIYMLLSGDVSFSIDGSLYKIEPFDMLLVSNKEIHRTIVNGDVTYERIYLYFDPEYITSFSDSSYDLLKMFENRRLGFGNKIDKEVVIENKLDEDLKEIYNWYHSDSPERYIMITSILLKMLVKINSLCDVERLDEYGLNEDVNYNEKIYQIIRYISSNLDRKISLDELEKEFFINKYHLCHLFKKITGFTVMEYMNYKKILAAREKLKKGVPVSEVWVNFGFDDYSSFFRSFKKVSRISPKEYLIKSMKKAAKK